jgi:hypothetical protein
VLSFVKVQHIEIANKSRVALLAVAEKVLESSKGLR